MRALRKARDIAELHAGLVGNPIPEEGESVEEFLAFQSKVRRRIDELRAELADLQAEADDDA